MLVQSSMTGVDMVLSNSRVNPGAPLEAAVAIVVIMALICESV